MLTIRKALDLRHLLMKNRMLHEELSLKYKFDNIVGKSKPMLKIYELITKVANTRATVLISGESGTGKELVARSIHFNSNRSEYPFVSVNCTALAETLLESELFGHEKGSFTGAVAMKKGRFELADKGTLFLDEVGEMSVSLQAKVLRVLQEMEFERVGGTVPIKVDVRIVAATNKNLKEEVKKGNFREDLFFRLNVVHINLPPIRERSDDIPLLISHFVDKYARENGKEEIKVTTEALKTLLNYKWPGNIRELENVIERAVILCNQNQITAADLPDEIRDSMDQEFDIDRFIPLNVKLTEALQHIEERMIRRALKQTNNVQAHAADLLGIAKNLFQYKMKKYRIKSSNI
jgi:two-component system NtrC family response regulator